MSNNSSRNSAVLCIALTGLFASQAYADPVTLTFTVTVDLLEVSGTARSFANLFGFPVATGDKLQGAVTYDGATPPTSDSNEKSRSTPTLPEHFVSVASNFEALELS
jgi:hypothetical protein